MPVSTDPKKIDALLSRGVEEAIDRDALKKKLLSGKKLRVKLGIDPTSPNLHLGRSVPLLKLRDFQDLGHQVVFIVGDFTGVIGDTSDKDSERPMLDEQAVKRNLKSYKAQAGAVIDLKKAEVHFNSKWLKKLTYKDVSRHANVFSLAEFIARDNIAKRLREGKRVSLREVLYPLMQGYDSVAVNADVELGGTDQRFNLIAGRHLQEYAGVEPQAILMNPLVEGTDGRKMSSSWGNTINFSDAPDEMFGKVMSIGDTLIVKYFTFFTRIGTDEIAEMERAMRGGANPRDAKLRLAHEIVRMYHGADAAGAAQEHFSSVFSKKEKPADMPALHPSAPDILTVLTEAGFAASRGEARRAIEQGGVRVNDTVVSAFDANVKAGDVVQKGKRFFVKIS
jgi:tyrosyl-tRNA synthetase